MGQSVAAILLEEPPEVEYRNGLFYIRDAEGMVRAMRPNVMFRGFQRTAKAIQDYYAAEGAEIIEFPATAHG